MTYEPLSRGTRAKLCLDLHGLGELVVAGDGHGSLVVVRSDPRIAVSIQLLTDWHQGVPPGVALSCRSATHLGDVIRVGSAVYVIERVLSGVAFEAVWPD